MLLSRSKAANDPKKTVEVTVQEKGKQKIIQLEDLIAERDYTGAIAYLEFCRQSEKDIPDLSLWLGYAAFHAGDYQRSADVYEEILKENSKQNVVFTYLACSYFMLGKYEEAEQVVLKAPKSPLQIRLLFHIAAKQDDEEKLANLKRQLGNSVEDQLSLASMLYMKTQYHEAIEIYKRLLTENRNHLALHVYLALCHYKLDLNDISQEILDVYLKKHSDSVTAINLQTCNQYRLYNGKAAENEMKEFLDKISTSFNYARDLFRHNMVVFQNGQNALQILPSLVDVIPEARINLAIYYLREDDLERAFDLMKDVQPTQSTEYILKGVVNAVHGQEHHSRENIKTAQSYFQLIGGAANDCDTIPGRQSMASSHFLHGHFDDVIVYLSSIKTYLSTDDTFNFNYAQAKAHEGDWQDAEEAFLLIQNEKIKNDYVYLSWLARCYIHNNKARQAWELYLRQDHSRESFALLQLIANDCYKRGYFFYSARAFDILERLDPNPEFWEGKLGACAGTFQQIIADKESREKLRDILSLLRNANHPQGDQMIKIMRIWAKTNNVPV